MTGYDMLDQDKQG